MCSHQGFRAPLGNILLLNAFFRHLMGRVDVTPLHRGIFNRWLPCSITRVKTAGGFYQCVYKGAMVTTIGTVASQQEGQVELA